MPVRMQGFALQKIYQNGKVSEKGLFGKYDGDEAQIVALKDGEVETASLSNHDIASLLALRASPHSLVERLEHDLGHGHRHRRHHTRRHHRRHHTHRHHRPHHHHRHPTRRRRHSHRHHRRHHSRHGRRRHHRHKHTRRHHHKKHRTRHR